jgi:5-formyltetrahydrofolate cyclo-ligase
LEILKSSNDIIAQLLQLPIFRSATKISAFISFGTEVNTHGLIKMMLDDVNKEVLVPVVSDREKRLLTLTVLNDWADLSTGAYGILEPKANVGKKQTSSEVDLCLVPGLAFDSRGNRIGYGGGYYDRLLSDINGRKVGLAYDFQILEQVPCEAHDEQVDMVLTEKRIIECR